MKARNEAGGRTSTEPVPSTGRVRWLVLAAILLWLVASSPAATPWISEFMADNQSVLADADGEFTDWIELLNPGPGALDLGGFYLTDSAGFPAQWRCPAGVIVPAGGFKIVFASGKDRTNAAAELHTNFQLNKDDGYLALVAPDGVTVLQAFHPYPAQQPNISFGPDAAVGTNVFFAQPTPGATNSGGALPALPKVEFSLNSQLFTNTLTLTLSNAQLAAAIYFTRDGSVPGTNSPRYTNSILITNSVPVRAVATLTGWSASPVKSESYVKISSNLAGFSSPLPVLVLHNFGAGAVPGVNSRGPNGDGSAVVEVALQSQSLLVLDRDTNGFTTFQNPVATGTRAGLRIRGSSSFSNTKKSYALETWGEVDQVGRDVSLLGLPADNDWVLYGPSWKNPMSGSDYDAALIHNSFIYELANLSGYAAPRTRFVEVFLNTTGGAVATNHYAGLFLLTEKIKRAEGRVDFPALSADGTTGGWLINADRMDALPPGSALGSMNPRHFHTAGPDRILQTTNDNARGFKGIRATLGGGTTTDSNGLNPARDDLPNFYFSQFNFESPDGWSITAAQRVQIETALRAFDTVLYGTNYTHPVTGYAAHLDVGNWVHHFILHNFPKNQDGEVLSTYFLRESPTAKIKHGPIWDFDRGYNKSPTSTNATANLDWCKDRLFYLRLFSDVNFQQAYIDLWQQLRSGAFHNTNLLAIVDRQVSEVAPGGTNNSVLGREGLTNWPTRILAFQQWLTNRTAALDAQFLKRPLFNQDGGAISNGFVVTLTNLNGSGTMFFALDGSDPRAPGGSVAPTAQAWPQTIGLNATTVLRARVKSGTNWSGLAEAVFYPPQNFNPLALTEIMFHPPEVGLTNGDNFEFLELKNTGTNTLNLSGLAFTGGIAFTFTNGTLLAPGAFFVLAKNAAAFAAKYPGAAANGLFTGKLDNAGETLTLATALGTAIFSVTYDEVAPWPVAPDGYGFSLVPKSPGLAPAPDNGAGWRASANLGGSPGADDPSPAIPAIVINEVMSASVSPQLDTIELLNLSGGGADVSGWFLTDDGNVPNKFRIPNGTLLADGGFAVFTEADFNPTPGTNLSFSLSSGGESIYLFSADTNGNLTGYSHGFAFGAAATGVSFGRHVNSAGEEQFPAQRALTFSAPNAGPLVGPAVFSEIMYHPPTGGVEFVEIANLTATLLPLFDPAYPTNTWRLGGASFVFPTNITLPPSGLVIVSATNEAGFRALHFVPTNVPVFGPWLGVLQDSGERLTLERPDAPTTNDVPYIVLDEVRYNDKAPWPPAADGSGPSLHRLALAAYGDEPANWIASAPTPGHLPELDSDGDGLPDAWELAHGLDPFSNDAALDSDGDGLSNAQEFLAGTDPQSAASTLRLEVRWAGDEFRLRFAALAGRSYVVETRLDLETGAWTNFFATNSLPGPQLIELPVATNGAQHFYRLVTPDSNP